MNVDRVTLPLRQGEEAPTCREDRIDRLARDAVIDDIEESDALAGASDIRDNLVGCGGAAVKAGKADRRN